MRLLHGRDLRWWMLVGCCGSFLGLLYVGLWQFYLPLKVFSVSVSYQFFTHHPALTASFVHRVVYMLGSEDICTLVLYYRDISW